MKTPYIGCRYTYSYAKDRGTLDIAPALQGCKGRGAEAPQILTPCYYVYKRLPQKYVQNRKNKDEKTAFRL